eukprot:gene39350-43781_t
MAGCGGDAVLRWRGRVWRLRADTHPAAALRARAGTATVILLRRGRGDACTAPPKSVWAQKSVWGVRKKSAGEEAEFDGADA